MYRFSFSLLLLLFVLASCAPVAQNQKLVPPNPWQEFEFKTEFITDNLAMYLYEANASDPLKVDVLAKKIVDYEESMKNPLSRRNEFEYIDAVKQYETTIPSEKLNNKSKKFLKVKFKRYLSPYDFDKQQFTLGFDESIIIPFKLGYALKFKRAGEFNSIKLTSEQARGLVEKFKLGKSYSDRAVMLEIFLEPHEFKKEDVTTNLQTSTYNMIVGQIHSIRIYHRPWGTENDSYMISLVNSKLYDVKAKKRL